MFKKDSYNGHVCVRVEAGMSRPTVSVFITGAGPNLVRPYIFPVKWRDYTCPIYNLSLKYMSNSLVHVINKITPFDQPGDVHVRVHFDILDNLAVLLLIGTSFLNRFLTEILPWNYASFQHGLKSSLFFLNTQPHQTFWMLYKTHFRHWNGY